MGNEVDPEGHSPTSQPGRHLTNKGCCDHTPDAVVDYTDRDKIGAAANEVPFAGHGFNSRRQIVVPIEAVCLFPTTDRHRGLNDYCFGRLPRKLSVHGALSVAVITAQRNGALLLLICGSVARFGRLPAPAVDRDREQ
ncbi:hypothetical protein HPB48_022945 [Haemaphysalis longicornis]|uniref:Uncharacterized protein n=1 Tax=Haemaphysalis longicornis TaxID=44386 RepID=A0A9J6GDB0_HAELO|nr:hypothetical protein HPB48_022945 [Haemaphysalis longicornis]